MTTPSTNVQQTIEQQVRMTIGNLHIELLAAQARNSELEAKVADLETQLAAYEPPVKNGKDKGKEAPIQ